MLTAIKMTLENLPLIAESNDGMLPYTEGVVKDLIYPTYFIVSDNSPIRLIVPEKAFKRRFKLVEPENPTKFFEVTKK